MPKGRDRRPVIGPAGAMALTGALMFGAGWGVAAILRPAEGLVEAGMMLAAGVVQLVGLIYGMIGLVRLVMTGLSDGLPPPWGRKGMESGEAPATRPPEPGAAPGGAAATAGRAVRWGLMAGGLACLGAFAILALWLRSSEPSLLTVAGAIFALPLVVAGLAMLAMSA